MVTKRRLGFRGQSLLAHDDREDHDDGENDEDTRPTEEPRRRGSLGHTSILEGKSPGGV